MAAAPGFCEYVLSVSVVVLGLALRKLWCLSTVERDPREPPIVYPRIPVIGHLLSFFLKPHQYLFDLK